MPRSDKSIAALAQKIPGEQQRLAGIELAKMRESIKLAEQAKKQIAEKKAEAADEIAAQGDRPLEHQRNRDAAPARTRRPPQRGQRRAGSEPEPDKSRSSHRASAGGDRGALRPARNRRSRRRGTSLSSHARRNHHRDLSRRALRGPDRLQKDSRARPATSSNEPHAPGSNATPTRPRIRLDLTIDGRGQSTIATKIPFFDHMLTLFARHSLCDLEVEGRRRYRGRSASHRRRHRHRARPGLRPRARRQARHSPLRLGVSADGRDARARRRRLQRAPVSRLPRAAERRLDRRVLVHAGRGISARLQHSRRAPICTSRSSTAATRTTWAKRSSRASPKPSIKPASSIRASKECRARRARSSES